MAQKPREILYANLKSKVGAVETFRCPLCRDGKEIDRLRNRLKAAEHLLGITRSIKAVPEGDWDGVVRLNKKFDAAIAAYDGLKP